VVGVRRGELRHGAMGRWGDGAMGRWGEEVFLTLARAATDNKKAGRFEPATDLEAWKAGYRERIAAAQALLASLPEDKQPKSAVGSSAYMLSAFLHFTRSQ